MVDVTNPKKSAKPRILLAGSGGGHVRQLLDLRAFWDKYSYSFVTEDTSLGRSIATEHPTAFVAHFAAGQIKLRKPIKFLRGLCSNVIESWRIVRREKPDLVLTTGAGSMIFIILFARIFGAQTILLDSFARFNSPSLFARLAGPLAHQKISQSARSARQWGGAFAFDPLTIEEQDRPKKDELLFATVGATLPFERLVRYVINAKKSGAITEKVVIQAGDVSELPNPEEGIEFVRELTFDKIHATLDKADLVVCHGGTGSLITALQNQCRVIAIPRLFELGEHYDNHQKEITEAFAARGLIEAAYDEPAFIAAIERARMLKPPKVRTDYSNIAKHLDDHVVQVFQAPQR